MAFHIDDCNNAWASPSTWSQILEKTNSTSAGSGAFLHLFALNRRRRRRKRRRRGRRRRGRSGWVTQAANATMAWDRGSFYSSMPLLRSIHPHPFTSPLRLFYNPVASLSLVTRALGWIGSGRFVFFPVPHLVLFFSPATQTLETKIKGWKRLSDGRGRLLAWACKITDESPSAWAARGETPGRLYRLVCDYGDDCA